MRFVDFAIDLAAVFNASRSVASKHVALRARQIDVYSRTSSVAASLRRKAAHTPSRAHAPEESGQSSSETKVENNKPIIEKDAVARESELNQEHDKSQGSAKTEELRGNIGQNKANSETDAFAEALASLRSAQNKEQELELPSGVDVNIFHTSRGSNILESVRKQRYASVKGQKPSGGAAKEHPLRYWPNPPPIQAEESPAPPALAPERVETKVEDPVKSEEEPEPAIPEEPVPKAEEKEPIRTTSASNVAETIAQAVRENAPPPSSQDPVANPLHRPASAHALRESAVPSSRLSRIWNYSGLAAGMLGGAVSEGFSRALGGGGQGSVLLSGKNMERLVAKLSRMRGAALKLGQMMSFQDTKMLPAPIQEVLQRVQDRADYMPAWQRDKVLVSNLGPEWRELFSEFEDKPIAAASIGQVHKAVLKSNGRRVAVKIQFPGVADSINSDLDNLSILLTATKLLPKGLYLNKTIDNARLELGWECDYVREAECATRYKELLGSEDDVFVVPSVYGEASGKQVLTMDWMDGIGVTRVKSFTQEQRDWIGTQILRLCLREITEFKFMQTDPNWTNFLYNADTSKLELLDFGASREYPDKFVTEYVRLLEAASRGDRATVKRLSESLGYLTGHESKAMIEAHTMSVLTLAEPFLSSAPEVYDFKDQTITERVKALIPVMLHERLAPPPEETYSLHRKLSGAFLLCARLGSKVRCREMFEQSLAKGGFI
ncbi:ABC1 family-domain-containing protein [Mariannaea sp. PMI_226]|nr:ABC1 family-domain-containing protein [Mariannaea sp. PMI_226]